MKKPADSTLVMFVCPKCGKHLEAMPSAAVQCKCGRQMQIEKPGNSVSGRA